jgi:hypothetical protein
MSSIRILSLTKIVLTLSKLHLLINFTRILHMIHLPEVNRSSSRNDYNNEKIRSEKSLQAVKKARKQIEADAQLLANRIALLKQEELKSWKKIEETKKKAREVFLLKKKNEERMREVYFSQTDY